MNHLKSLFTFDFRAITHDPAVYASPNAFIPERHLKDNGKADPITAITGYGFGRR